MRATSRAIDSESSIPWPVVSGNCFFFLFFRALPFINTFVSAGKNLLLLHSAIFNRDLAEPVGKSMRLLPGGQGCTPISKLRVERASRYWYCEFT